MTTIDSLQYLRAEVRKLNAYPIADAQGYIKLDAMENPYAWPGELLSAWQSALADIDVNRYPAAAGLDRLKSTLFEVFGPPQAGLDMLFGNGSDEILQLLVMAIAQPGANVMTVTPSFSMYRMICQYVNVPCIEVPLSSDFSLDPEAIYAAIEAHNPTLVFLAYPNNPTGNLWDAKVIQTVCEKMNGLVVIDEAYAPFASHSLAQLAVDYANVLILKTASKLGLAGIRFGWLTAHQQLIHELNKIRLPYNINVLSQVTMQFALENYTVLEQQAATICKHRADMIRRLRAFDNLTVFDSEANFILFRLPPGIADCVDQHLRADRILVKNLNSQAYLQDCLRVTVGTQEENELFIDSLQAALKG